jgi:serine/threonine-protein kinase
MVSFEGEIKVVDFGIAKAESKLETTRAGTLKGKFSYMSPEQASGQPLDLRTDIFSLGIVFWELLANDRLFAASNEINTLRKVKECKIPSLRAINPNIPAELEQIVSKSLAKDRNMRYQTAAAFYRDLNRFLNRHYPDFSAHDIASFIKSIYSDEIIEHRKKMMDYAHIKGADLRPVSDSTTGSVPSPNPAPTSAARKEVENPKIIANGSHLMPQALEDSESFFVFETEDEGIRPIDYDSKEDPKPDSPAFEESKAIAQVKRDPNEIGFSDREIKDLQRITQLNDRRISSTRSVRVDYDNFTSGHTNTGSHYGSVPKPYGNRVSAVKKPNILLPSLALIGVAIGLYIWISPQSGSLSLPLKIGSDDKTQSEGSLASGTSRRAAEVGQYHLTVDSNPPGAQVFINNIDTQQVTKAIVSIPADKPFKLTIRKTGYRTIERWLQQKEPVGRFNTNLAAQPTGYVRIIVPIGARHVIINGDTFEYDRNRQYPVPANIPVRITAVGLTGGSDEQTVTIGRDRSKEVYLNPVATKR